MSILEEIAYVDNVQQFIRGHIDNLAIEHSQGVPKVLFNNGFNFDESNNTDPIHQEKLITENKEDFKNEIENFDNNLRINDMDESKIDESPNLASIEIYKSSKRKKSKGMLSQYKSFTIKKDIMNAFNSENSASLQLGQGCQNSIKNPNKINLKIKTKNGKENNRYPKSNISLRNPDKWDSPLLSNWDKETYRKKIIYFIYELGSINLYQISTLICLLKFIYYSVCIQLIVKTYFTLKKTKMHSL